MLDDLGLVCQSLLKIIQDFKLLFVILVEVLSILFDLVHEVVALGLQILQAFREGVCMHQRLLRDLLSVFLKNQLE